MRQISVSRLVVCCFLYCNYALCFRLEKQEYNFFYRLRLCSGTVSMNAGYTEPLHENNGTHKFVKKLLALPYLPADAIAATFDELISTVQLTASLQQLVDYDQRQWIDGRFPPTNWSVYMKTVRTNNDTEGHHRKLNDDKHKMPFYLLVQKLRDEATDVAIMATLHGV